MAVSLLAAIAFVSVLVAVLLLLFWPRSPRVDITTFPRKYRDEKVTSECCWGGC